MAASGWVFFLAAMLSLAFTVAHNHYGETDTYHVSVGHLFLLECLSADAYTNMTWSREGHRNLSLPTGVEVRDGLLWFLPVQVSHNGSYTCEERGKTKLLRRTFGVSVSSGACPDAPETISMVPGVSKSLPCKQQEIFKLDKTRNIRWMKDCQRVEQLGDHISVDKSGSMRLSTASERDAGKYTCLVDISLDGRNYTAARSIQLTSKKGITVITKPEVLRPQQQVVVVEEGTRAVLECYAYIGFSEENEAFMYWTVDEDHTDNLEGVTESWKYVHKRGRVYGLSTLNISKVFRQFLNVPISCYVSNPAGLDSGVVWLQEADYSALYTRVALCLAASLAVLALAAALLFFKVDLVLTHRKLLRHFSKGARDGKLYDAYVSFLPPGSLSSAEMANLALQTLPQELERQHGYSLYIRGRDDCPGEAVHDVIAATVQQCRRLIIILSPEVKSSTHTKPEEALLLDNQNQLCYEQKIGLHDALTRNDPRVILVEIDGPVDYSHMPESLRFIKRKQGALKWKKTSHKATNLHPNRNFWKNLRYHMPSVPAGRFQTVV